MIDTIKKLRKGEKLSFELSTTLDGVEIKVESWDLDERRVYSQTCLAPMFEVLGSTRC